MKVQIEILKRINNQPVGTLVNVEIDSDGIALDRFWRKRIQDMKIDNCIRFTAQESVKQKTKTQSTKIEDTDNGNSNS